MLPKVYTWPCQLGGVELDHDASQISSGYWVAVGRCNAQGQAIHAHSHGTLVDADIATALPLHVEIMGHSLCMPCEHWVFTMVIHIG